MNAFDLSPIFSWSPSCPELQIAFFKLTATLNVQQSPQEYGRDISVVQMGFRSQLSGQLIILLTYPQPSQSYIFFGKQWMDVGFLFDGMVNSLNVDWTGLASTLYPFTDVYVSRWCLATRHWM